MLPALPCCRPQALVADQLAVNIGAELLKLVPGRVRGGAERGARDGAGRGAGWKKQQAGIRLALVILPSPSSSAAAARSHPWLRLPGRYRCRHLPPPQVSTEVDAHLSYDTQATYDKALHLLDLYVARGVDPGRLYIKVRGWAVR